MKIYKRLSQFCVLLSKTAASLQQNVVLTGLIRWNCKQSNYDLYFTLVLKTKLRDATAHVERRPARSVFSGVMCG